MAKVKAGIRSRRGSTKNVSANVVIHRTADRGVGAFEACVRFGKLFPKMGSAVECAYGKNPRAAVGNAMTQLGRALKKRRGAFRGRR